MTFDFDKELQSLIKVVTITEEDKLAFALGYNAGHTTATKIPYTSRAAIVVDMIEKYAEQNSRSFVVGYLVGISDTHIKIMHADDDESDCINTENIDESKYTETDYDVKQTIPIHIRENNVDTA